MGESMFTHSEKADYRWSFAISVIACVIGAAALIAPEQKALAQSVADDGVLEEIVVSARRYEESLQDAPVAVGVLTDEFIKNNRIQRADDILEVTPGATYESFSKMQPVASMRGIIAPTPGNASSEASIQTVIDNVVITKDFMKSPALYDLERVEVLRGPQGTSFGRNASVGLIHFVNKRPSQQKSRAFTVTGGSDELIEVDGHFNGGVSDAVSARFAFNYDSQDGPTESLSLGGGGLDGDRNAAFRLGLLIEPSENFSAYLKAEYSEDRDEAPVRHGFFQPGTGWTCTNRAYVYGVGDTDPGYPDSPAPPGVPPGGAGQYSQTFFAPCDPFTTEISPATIAGFPSVDFHTNRDILTLTAELAWNFGNNMTLTSITGYMDGDTDSLADVIGSPADVGWQSVVNDGESLSQEFRIDNMASDSSVRWLVGAYFLADEEDRAEQLQFQMRDDRAQNDARWAPTVRETGGFNETTSSSVFGEISFDISDRATITYGGRYVSDDKDYITRSVGWGTNRQLVFLPGVDALQQDGGPVVCTNMGPPSPTCGSESDPVGFTDHLVTGSWDDYISKLSFDFEINDNMTVYALYSEGFKSGTFQPDALNPAQADLPVNPEDSTNFEVGLKGAGDRYRYSATAYYMEIDDVQTVNLVVAGSAFLGLMSNIGSVESRGIELDGTFLVTDNFLISGNVGIIDAEMKNTPDPVDSSIDISGHRPPGAPEWTYAVFGELSFPMGNGSEIQLRADVRGRSDVYNQSSSRTGPRADARLRPEIHNIGARISWISSSGDTSVSLWGKNLNEDYDIENFGPPSPCCSSFAAGFRGKSSYGITASFDFDE
jgi:iron complex outermembrane receptor protein